MSWPIMMILYIIFAYYFQTWQDSLIYFCGIPLFIIGFAGFAFNHIHKNEVIETNTEN